MMICPDAYYEQELKGKTKEQVFSQIRSLKWQIGNLKNQLEAPDTDKGVSEGPSEITQISYLRAYLDRAKLAYAQLGGEYKPSKAEQSALEFERRIPEISTATLIIGGFFSATEVIEVTVKKDEVIIKNTQRAPGLNREDDWALPSYSVPKILFFQQLEELHIGEWRHFYSTRRFGYQVMDGIQWELSFVYAGNPRDRVSFHGDNSFPYNFAELLCLLRGADGSEDEEPGEILLTGEQETVMNKLADYVADLHDGTSITTAQALGKVFPDFDFRTEAYAGIGLFDVHEVLLQKLIERGIYPDMRAHYGLVEGLPFNLDFIVHHMDKDE